MVTNDPIVYACHSIWIGPSAIPTEAIFNLYEKIQMYSIDQYHMNSFIPTICLNQDAILYLDQAAVTLKLISIDECPNSHIHIKQTAKQLTTCDMLLAIDLGHNQDIGYIPVLVWEELINIINIKINSYIPDIDELMFLTTNIYPEILKIKLSTPIHTLANNIFEDLCNNIINYLYNNGAYVAASDLIRLLLLLVLPGCYSDIGDIKLKRLPRKEDFERDFLVRRKENSIIVSLNSDIMYNIIFCMYTAIFFNKEYNCYTPLSIEEYLISNIDFSINKLIKTQICFYCIHLNQFISAVQDPNMFIADIFKIPHIKIQEWLVNYIAGFYFWQPIVEMVNVQLHNTETSTITTPNILTVIFPGGQKESKINGCSWDTPGILFINKLYFLNQVLLKDYHLYKIAIREIDNIAKEYDIDKISVIVMAILTGYFYKKESEYYNYQTVIEHAQKSANLKYQELYNSTSPILFSSSGSTTVNLSLTPSPPLCNGSLLHNDDIAVTLNRSFNNCILNLKS